MVVSMRPLTPADAIRAIQVTSRYPADARRVGPFRRSRRDRHRRPEAPGLRRAAGPRARVLSLRRAPQAVVAASRPALCITHKPGHMLMTDLRPATGSPLFSSRQRL